MDSNGNVTDSRGKPILDSSGKPIKIAGYDSSGNPIFTDSNGNLVDSNGKPILDSSGKPIKVSTDSNGNVILTDSKGNVVDSKGNIPQNKSIRLVGYDSSGNPIYADSEGNLVDSKGNLILDSSGKPISVKIGKDGKPILVDSNGNVTDSRGKPILDSNGKPIKIAGYDSSGNPIFADSNGNLVDSESDLILDENNKPIKVKVDDNGNIMFYNSDDILIDNNKLNILIEKHKVEKELKKKRLQRKTQKPQQSNKSQSTKVSKAKSKSKGSKPKQPRHPILDEYGVDSLSELDKNISDLEIDELIRQSLLVSKNTTTKQANNEKYGVSEFSNQESIDIATNEHKLYRMIPAGKLIPCVLLTPINSEIEGLVSAQVEQDIYAYMGRAVLIPRGSKVIGFYKNDNDVGQARLQIIWREILTPQGVNIILTNAVTGDSEGYAGAKGYLNNRYWQRYGMAITMQTLANSITFGVANATAKQNQSIGSSYMIGQVLSQGQSDINNALKQILSKQTQIKPVIKIMAGSRIYITPSTHIWFPIPKKNEIMAQYFIDEEK